ncbi:MAG: hypothetical protein VW547_02955 [Alphaproteobacteria bacterium]
MSITILVTYKPKPGTDRAAAKAQPEVAAPKFAALEGLQTKYFLYYEAEGLGGGFYIWPSCEQAEAFHCEAWLVSMEELMGSRPECPFFETNVIVDNQAGEVLVEAA